MPFPIHLFPQSLPTRGTNCLYLYLSEDRVKIGRSANLKGRNMEYKARKMPCVSYATGFYDLNRAENALIEAFMKRFQTAKRYNCREWFIADCGEAFSVFHTFVLRYTEPPPPKLDPNAEPCILPRLAAYSRIMRKGNT